MSTAEVLVVGAGPAGIAAATEAARAGAGVIVLDEYPRNDPRHESNLLR
jgi:flavin-dependent dehydrogenase